MANLELWFEKDPEFVLDRTVFCHGTSTSCTDRRNDPTPVQWRSGVIAHVALLIDFAWRGQSSGESCVAESLGVPAIKDSPAGSVKDSLTKHLSWRARVLGDLSPTDLFHVRHQNHQPWIALNEQLLRPSDIRVFVGKVAVEDPAHLKAVANIVERQWIAHREHKRPGGHHRGRVIPHPPNPLGRLTSEERDRLEALAAASLECPAERLPHYFALVIGKARRIQLVAELRRCLSHFLYRLENVPWDIEREPKWRDSLEQTRGEAVALANGFSEGTRRIEAQAAHWPKFQAVFHAIQEAVKRFLASSTEALKGVEDAQIPAALGEARRLAATSQRELNTFQAKLNAMYADQLEQLQNPV